MDQTPQLSNKMLLWQTKQIKPPLVGMLKILIVGGQHQMRTLRFLFLTRSLRLFLCILLHAQR
jgi:hypothetical protein